MTRKINFGAGPAALPESVLKRAQAELLDYNNLGLSVCGRRRFAHVPRLHTFANWRARFFLQK